MLKHWVVLRHFEVAALRSRQRDGKNRFRLVVGDQGLQTFDLQQALYRPTMPDDRLPKALMLCEQARLLKGENETYALTPKGLRRLPDTLQPSRSPERL